MKKFEFRLEKVLEYREMAEEWAKEAYLDARTARLEAELILYGIDTRRQELLKMNAQNLDERRAIELRLLKLDEQEHEQKMVVSVLLNEENTAMEDWKEKRIELEVLQKLREKALDEWKLDASRFEQAELDEWATTRRAAA